MNLSLKISMPRSRKWSINWRKNLNILLLLLLLGLLLAEAWVINSSIGLVLNFSNLPIKVGHSKEVRVNFPGYNQAIKRIEQAANYTPNNTITQSPFKSK